MWFKFLTPTDVAKDFSVAGAFTSPMALFGHLDATIILGILSLIVQTIFRYVQLRRLEKDPLAEQLKRERADNLRLRRRLAKYEKDAL